MKTPVSLILKILRRACIALPAVILLHIPAAAVAEGYDRAMESAQQTPLFSPRLNGSMMPYDFERCDTAVPWDNGFTPIFISYVARHGARFLSSDKKTSGIMRWLTEARDGGYLSEKGEAFLHLLHETDSVTDGNWGALNAEGICEERRLGKEMARIAPALLKKGKAEAAATYVPRVVMTMYELCHQLARHSSNLEISTSEGRQFDRMLRFFTTDTAYMAYLDHGEWLKAYGPFAEENAPWRPARSLFTKNMDEGKMKILTLAMYGVLQSLPAARMPWNPGYWFSEPEYRACWEIDNLKHYYQRSANRFSVLPAKSAGVLLDDIIAGCDSAAAGSCGDTVAALRFGHAETVMPLFALMRLPGCYLPEATPNEVAAGWKDWEVSPLGANLMIVMLKDSSGKIYASLRLNGRWLTLDYSAPGGETRGNVIPWHLLKERLRPQKWSPRQ